MMNTKNINFDELTLEQIAEIEEMCREAYRKATKKTSKKVVIDFADIAITVGVPIAVVKAIATLCNYTGNAKLVWALAKLGGPWGFVGGIATTILISLASHEGFRRLLKHVCNSYHKDTEDECDNYAIIEPVV